MKTMIFSLMLISSSTVFAEAALHAHEHGAIALEMAVEGKVATFSVDGPAESFLGFEYLPKSSKDKKTFNDAKNLWTKKFFELVSFETSAGCKITESAFEQKVDAKETAEEQAKIKDPKKKEKGVHSDVEATAKITCAKDLKGIKISVNLKKHFKHIKKLKMELIGNEAKSVDINSESFETNL